ARLTRIASSWGRFVDVAIESGATSRVGDAAAETLEVLFCRRPRARLLGRLHARLRGSNPRQRDAASTLVRRASGQEVVESPVGRVALDVSGDTASAGPSQAPESGEAFSCSRATDQIVLVVNGPRFLRILLERGAGRCRQAIHRPTACVRCRANGGAREFLPRGLGGSRQPQQMRKRGATPATDPSSKKENPPCSSFP